MHKEPSRPSKEKIFIYFSKNQTYNDIDKLPDFVYGYNYTIHHSITMALVDVTSKEETALWKFQYVKPYTKLKNIKAKKKNFQYKVGDTV